MKNFIMIYKQNIKNLKKNNKKINMNKKNMKIFTLIQNQIIYKFNLSIVQQIYINKFKNKLKMIQEILNKFQQILMIQKKNNKK